jgi:hypothetical protein
MLNKIYTTKLQAYIDRDRDLLIKILKQRSVLLKNGEINGHVIRIYAHSGLKEVCQLLLSKRISTVAFLHSIRKSIGANDFISAFYQVFYYCSFFQYELPEILLPIAAHEEALKLYFQLWVGPEELL